MGDWVGVVEAAYDPAGSDAAWAGRVIDALRRLLPSGTGIGINALEHSADCSSARVPFMVGDHADFIGPSAAMSFRQGPVEWLGPQALRALYYPPRPVASFATLLPTLESKVATSLAEALDTGGHRDLSGLFAHPEPGFVVVVALAGMRISGPERRFYTELALHLETALRLRRRPEVVRAILGVDGSVKHADASTVDLDLARDGLRRIERARTRLRRRDPEALGLWTALVEGGMSLVERTEGARRFYLVVDNPPSRQPLRAFTPREQDVVSYAARGLSSKFIAYALGLPTSTVSRDLARAASKIGLSSRIELVRVAAMLARDPRARFGHTALTTAEREVLALVEQGLSNDEVARLRGRSIRTIANQVAALLRKTQTPSRRALVARSARMSAEERRRRGP